MTPSEKGSLTAKAGFANEDDVVDRFNNWQQDELAQDWLIAMGYQPDEIEYVVAEKIPGSYKADVQVKVTIKLKKLVDCQNLQVKLVSNDSGFNQIDKRWLNDYKVLWEIPDDVLKILKFYTGELPPYKANTRDSRRMFMNEMSLSEQQLVLDWIKENQCLIVSDILRGRGRFAAEWYLVIKKTDTSKKVSWALKPINYVINFFGSGDVSISDRGTIHVGKITIQRKGGDGGRPSAKMLQFKIDPLELLA